MQAKKELEEYLNDSLVNKTIISNVPDACMKNACILGIDEAGRGPVLGPMSYAIAYYPEIHQDVLAKMKFADSKALTESTRENLFESLQTRGGGFQDIGYVIKIISPNMISNSMLRRKKYNLNALSHDTAIDLIRTVQSKNIKVAHVYIDTVGPPVSYREKLQRFFPGVAFTVTEKADSKYPIVSAASVCAKVMRDRIVQNWKYLEGKGLNLDTFKLGSGYPADPDTKKFIEKSVDPVFGYPTLARFSWSTIGNALKKHGSKCDWNEPDEDNVDPKQLTKQQQMMKTFAVAKTGAKKPSTASCIFFDDTLQKAAATTKQITNASKFFSERMMERVDSI